MWPFSRLNRKQNEPVGPELASQVADILETGRHFGFTHRDYCGMGLRRDGDIYVYDMVVDGDIATAQEISLGQRGASSERLVFMSKETLTAWLQVQTDDSLSGADLPEPRYRGNQRVTVNRLREFAANNSFKPNPLRYTKHMAG